MLIFDMDGTLIDSNGIWRQVDEAFLAKRGYPYTREYYEGVAHTIFPMAAKFTKAYCHLEESEEEIMAEWMQMAGDAYAVRVPIKPGVREYLDRCRTAGERMIVLTSSVPEHCRAALGRLGLTEYFERILFAHGPGRPVPPPPGGGHGPAAGPAVGLLQSVRRRAPAHISCQLCRHRHGPLAGGTAPPGAAMGGTIMYDELTRQDIQKMQEEIDYRVQTQL